MKKIKFLALAFVIATSSLFAKEIIPDVPLTKIQVQLVELFETPDFDLEDDINCNIYFSFTADGKIEVLRIDSRNADVKKYVHQYLDNKLLATPGEVGKVYRLPLKLKKFD